MDKKQILIVDDEVDFTEIVSTLLDFHNFQADTINDPKQVVEALQKKHYDLIVTDLMMPGMDGFQLVETLRGDPKYHNIPVIVLSAKLLSDEERKRLLVSNVSFLTKPFEPQGLVEKITQMLA
ncbi:MAG: hypothetical protein COV45_02365 [Deltaproteobacteria bacterium CG11_big_fil_rev_8_21_14_0_20_47_16]|nr:MAG: hypothetical protein COV45_02365 [Deltaproteobacteria bacterium CG11_big_fil_rev_8_21_14_0_20_47_16]